MSRIIGFAAEEVAKNYLVARGLQWVHSQYQSRYGEIDLIMRDRHHLVFVEVKFRQGGSLAAALESITPQKQKKVRVTAAYYLSGCGGHMSEQVRFDVIIIRGVGEIEWIQDAFQ